MIVRIQKKRREKQSKPRTTSHSASFYDLFLLRTGNFSGMFISHSSSSRQFSPSPKPLSNHSIETVPVKNLFSSLLPSYYLLQPFPVTSSSSIRLRKFQVLLPVLSCERIRTTLERTVNNSKLLHHTLYLPLPFILHFSPPFPYDSILVCMYTVLITCQENLVSKSLFLLSFHLSLSYLILILASLNPPSEGDGFT